MAKPLKQHRGIPIPAHLRGMQSELFIMIVDEAIEAGADLKPCDAMMIWRLLSGATALSGLQKKPGSARVTSEELIGNTIADVRFDFRRAPLGH